MVGQVARRPDKEPSGASGDGWIRAFGSSGDGPLDAARLSRSATESTIYWSTTARGDARPTGRLESLPYPIAGRWAGRENGLTVGGDWITFGT